MSDEPRYESEDLEDYDTDDAYDSLVGDPGDDPLDAGVITPQHWTAGMRFGTTASEQQDGESLDQMLSAEEPDIEAEDREDQGQEPVEDEDAGDQDVDGLLLDDGPDPRAGRLVAEDEGIGPETEPDLVARDAGIDGGAATAEESALHVVDEDDYDIRSE
jgi:Family of unknown function (DUF5709)